MAEPKVRQAFTAYEDDYEASPMLSRLGAKVVIPLKEQLVLGGYCFISTGTESGVDGETGELGAGAMAIDPAEPSFMFDVPPGLTVLPLEVNITHESTGANAIVAVMSDSIERYSTGGVAAVAARNLRTNCAYGSSVRNLYSGDSVITAATASSERIHYLWSTIDDVNADEGQDYPYILWRPVAPPTLVGPASFLVYHHCDTGGAEFRISVVWAELPTTHVE